MKKSSKIVYLLAVTFAILCSSLLGSINFSTAYAYDFTGEQTHAFFQVEVKDRNDKTLHLPTEKTYQYSPSESATAFYLDTKDVLEFILHFNFSSSATSSWTESPTVINSQYKLTVETEYLKGYSSAYFCDDSNNLIDAVIVDRKIKTIAEADGYETLSSYTQTVEASKWGIYRFKMTLGTNIIYYSDFFIVQPTKQVTNAPQIKDPSQTLDTITYTINLTDEYKYADENQIKWYIYGKTTSGDNYALTEDDLNEATFINLNCNKALYKTVDRTGYSFTIQKLDLEPGEWQVWCEFTPYGSTQTTASAKQYIKGFTISFPIYWIIGALIVAILTGTIIVTVVKVKRDKIY